ncbi:signal peptidase II [Angustibacter speluncae]
MSDDAQGPREPADPADTAPVDRAPDAGDGAEPAPSEVDPRRRRRLLVLLAVVCVLAYAADQVTKWIALQQLADGRVVPVVDGWFSLRLLFNPGAAFSLGEGTTWLFTGVAVVVVVVIVRTSRRLGSLRWALALGFLLGGALGNLTDRLVREPGFARGHVIDFLAYADWFVGNVADVWIVGAAAAVALLGLLGIGVDGTREKDQRAAAREAQDASRG